MFWLRTGVFWPWECATYGEIMTKSFRPKGTDQTTLSDFLSAPISVKDVPIHGVIMGMLFATLSSIPILAAILYRFPAAVPFAAMVVFLAAMPWLGITVLGGCVLASLPPFRFGFRYASALLGLVPVGVYFVMASWEPAGARGKSMENVALLYAPWVLALLSCCVICAVTLAISKLINYRPGGIAPVLAVLFAIPVILFHTKVGRDELEYRLIERQIGPACSTRVQPVDIGAQAEREATRQWSETHFESYAEIKKRALENHVKEHLDAMESERAAAEDLCDSFIERLPQSQYVPNILFLKGEALDRRINKAMLQSQHRAELRSDWPRVPSRRAWQTLHEQFPGNELTSMAIYKLAILQAREGRFDEAIRLLDKQDDQFNEHSAAGPPVAGASPDRSPMFKRRPSSEALGLEPELLLRQGRRLSEKLRACRDDLPRPYKEIFSGGHPIRLGATVHPLSLLMCLDETDPNYEYNLQAVVDHFPKSRAAGYAEVRLIARTPAISRRIAGLRAAAERLSGEPAGAEAHFLLAEVRQEDSLLDEARDTFTELVRTFPDSCWAAEAKERLSALAIAERAAR
jgi:outer membrane protein assembly factor BamD (BamD/ComL family)